MKIKLAVSFAALPALLLLSVPAFSQHHEEVRHEEARHEAVRVEAPKWEAHAPGVHPKGAAFHAHQVRVLAAKVVKWNSHAWKHWEHPDFARPHYYWAWNTIHSVSCTAEDSYGDQYPVTVSTFHGFGFNNMTSVEDDALDRCYAESGSDTSCYLATCSHF